ncbi:hypothetical protein VHEMI05412 [[Torrubiella] hemipterigena]|uniref:N-acetyltransferase domain-containing protein n=1 Tax=[Torrubiella] hemipterigena TaxID=1531966 RepID=A0A0A1T429_9HYPO|nr:hypothetical protein VHEMI05412 [[Torrubiella] hemipterigena]
MPPSPRLTTPSMHLNAMAVSKSHQRRGIGRALVAWGKTHGLPIYVTGEEGGLKLYRACGFHVIRDTQVWLKSAGVDVDEADSSAWERDQGGCSMGECVWVPPRQESSASSPSEGGEEGQGTGMIEIRRVAYSASE